MGVSGLLLRERRRKRRENGEGRELGLELQIKHKDWRDPASGLKK